MILCLVRFCSTDPARSLWALGNVDRFSYLLLWESSQVENLYSYDESVEVI